MYIYMYILYSTRHVVGVSFNLHRRHALPHCSVVRHNVSHILWFSIFVKYSWISNIINLICLYVHAYYPFYQCVLCEYQELYQTLLSPNNLFVYTYAFLLALIIIINRQWYQNEARSTYLLYIRHLSVTNKQIYSRI